MDTKQQLDELIDRYLSGKMTDSEKVEFEMQISQNPQLKEEVDLHNRIVDAIKAKNVKRILQYTEQNMRHTKSKRNLFIGTISTVAAAACILFAVLFINDDSLYYKSFGDRYYAELSIPVVRGGNDADSLLLIAYQYIGMENYNEARKNINVALEILHKETFDISTEEGQYYQELIKRKVDEAQWLKVVSYMKQGKKRKSKEILTQIANSDSFYKSLAEKTLQK